MTKSERVAAKSTSCRSPRQIDESEQNYPDQIDKVPVQTGNADLGVIAIRIRVIPGPPADHNQDGDADRDVNPVQRRRDEIEREELEARASLNFSIGEV